MDLEVREQNKEIPVWKKVLLTVDEAVKYSNIGRDKLYQLCHEPDCKFVIKNGRNILIKRKKFESFIDEIGYI